jgi:hypothetical protein
MLVEEVIKKLESLNPKSKIYLQVDPEGNGYNELYHIDDNCVFIDDTMYSLSWSADEACVDDDEWEEIKAEKKCVVLAP